MFLHFTLSLLLKSIFRDRDRDVCSKKSKICSSSQEKEKKGYPEGGLTPNSKNKYDRGSQSNLMSGWTWRRYVNLDQQDWKTVLWNASWLRLDQPIFPLRSDPTLLDLFFAAIMRPVVFNIGFLLKFVSQPTKPTKATKPLGRYRDCSCWVIKISHVEARVSTKVSFYRFLKINPPPKKTKLSKLSRLVYRTTLGKSFFFKAYNGGQFRKANSRMALVWSRELAQMPP